jgi:hypothetical protein
MPAVLAALKDFKTPIHSIFRLIACHIAIVIMDVRDTAAHPARRFRLKSYSSEIIALRQLRSVLKLAARYRGTEGHSQPGWPEVSGLCFKHLCRLDLEHPQCGV